MQQFIEFFLNHWDLFLMLVVILGLLAGQGLLGRLRGVAEVGPQEAVQKINHDDALLVDVREDKEYAEGHVPGSIHIPLSSFRHRAEELEKHREKPIIVGCRSGNRSAQAAGNLRKLGFGEVYNLRGGILAWQNANLPVSTQSQGKKK